MQDVIINHPAYANLLWIVIAVAAVIATGFALRRRALAQFVSSKLRGLLVPTVSQRKRRVKAVLAVAALALVVLALLDIRWGRQWREVPQSGVEVMFVLDVSRSMLADDASPTRLDRAKQYIQDVIDQLDGDRVGLFVFAGQPRQKVPLTSNYHDFHLTLSEAGPHSAARGGSRLGDAIRAAADAFVDATPDHKAIVVIADGEDQESDPVEAARSAYEDKGIRVYTVGLGDIDRGAAIRLANNQVIQHQGETVITRMDGQTLEAVALAGGGAFVPAGTSWVNMGDVYRTHIGAIADRNFADARAQTWTPRYHWFVAAALALLLLDGFLSDRRKTRPRRGATAAVALTLAAAPTIAMAQTTAPEPPHAAYNESVELYRQGDLDQSSDKLKTALDRADPGLEARARFNLGNVAYSRALQNMEQDKAASIEQLKTAITHYRDTLRVAPYDSDARANIELARRLMDQLKDEQKQEQEQQQQQQDQQQQQEQQNQPQQQQQQQNQQDQNQQDQQEQPQQQQEQDPQNAQQPQDASEGQPDEPRDEQQPEQEQDQDQKPDQGEPNDPDDVTEGKVEAGDTDAQPQERDAQGQPLDVSEQELTEEEAAKLLQAIRDKEHQRRMEQQYLEARRQRPVEKDW